MDKIFAKFIENFGNPIERREVPPSSIELYKEKLPPQLLYYWAAHGWGGYGNGIFWLVNPQEYNEVVTSWLEGTTLSNYDNYHLIARSAFGHLYLWGENTGFSLKISAFSSRCMFYNSKLTKEELNTEIQRFFVSRKVDSNDFNELYNPAQKKLGTLQYDEMYGFFPALMLGGSDSIEHLKKVKSIEHLLFLSQLTDLIPYEFSDQPT